MFRFIKRKVYRKATSYFTANTVSKLWNYVKSNRSKITELCTYTNWIEEELKEMRKDLNEARIQLGERIEYVETIVEERK